ncbi:LLM class flavin-dependent oxidoreductase [Rhodococcus koreensis]|uniref:LLM class flavin-dependent oxidoreductase n=1 Tax=Rhodococcus koreensis TaxID=99653 RepID=UPI0036DE2900
MKISIFVEVTVPRPWAPSTEHQAFTEVLEQIEFADKQGFHSVWVTEHHFMEEYAHASAPEILLAAAARTTTNIRLGHGIVSMPPGVNHPARVAERISTLDLISNGRVEFGTGESSSVAELGGFEIDPGKKREMWREGVKVATRCMSEEPFTGFTGEFVSMPPRNVVPKPMQRPHPPVWVACTRPATMTMAAENGLGALAFVTKADVDSVRADVERYYSTFESSAVPLTGTLNPNVLYTGGNMMVASSYEKAVDRIGHSGGFFPWAIGYYYVTGDHHPGRDELYRKYEAVAKGEAAPHELRLDENSQGTRADWKRLASEALQKNLSAWPGVGTPDMVRDRIRAYEDAGLDQLMFLLPPVKHEFVMESLEFFGKEIIPEFHERDEKLQREKAIALEPALERAMSRRVDDAPAYDPEYSFGGAPVSFDKKSVASEVAESRLGLSGEAVQSMALRRAGVGS